MKIVEINKKNGKIRKIYVPCGQKKNKLRCLIPDLRKKVINICNMDAVHAFLPEHNAVTCARKHIGYKYTLNFDLTDFFDNITPASVKKILSKEELRDCFVDGHPRQGLPTSPDISNLAGKVIDDAIIKWLKQKDIDAVYTRYADDISLSYNDVTLAQAIMNKVKEIVHRSGFELNHKKTKYYTAKGGMRIVCGIAVGEEDIYPTRKTRRKLRAAKHHGNTGSISGLQEWMQLKVPNNIQQKEVKMLKKYYKTIEKISVDRLIRYSSNKMIKDENFGDNVFITNDIPYFLGMTEYATGWNSCYHRKGRFSGDPVAYLSHPGISLAILVGDNKKCKGVFRHVLLARTIVYLLENNKKVYGKLYGTDDSCKNLLRKKLKENGYTDCDNASGRVQGSFDICPDSTDRGRFVGDNTIQFGKRETDLFGII